jgi:hypothetical protein
MPTTTDELQFTNITRIAGQSEEHAVDVLESMGRKRMSAEVVDVATAIASGVVSVGLTPIEAKSGATILTNRKSIMIRNVATKTVYLGNASVTTLTGMPIEKGETLTIGASNSIYLIADSSSNSVRVLEAS